MNRIASITALTLASNFAVAADFTGDLAPAMWSMHYLVPGGPASPSVTQATSDTLDLNYNFDGNRQSPKNGFTQFFSVYSARTGDLSFDYDYTGNHSWFQAHTSLRFFYENEHVENTVVLIPLTSVGGDFSFSGSVTIPVMAGSRWGFAMFGLHNDGAFLMHGTIHLSNLVPAPGACALAGMGCLAMARRRRA
jgi:hypothetical protein